MTKMDRAGRKNMMKIILRMAWRKDNDASLTVGQIAKKMGMKSSTELKKMLREMIEIDDEIMLDGRTQVFKVMFKPYVQQKFESRFLVINGEKKKVASWVLDFVGGGQDATPN